MPASSGEFDDLCKQFGLGSGPTNHHTDLDPNCLIP